MPSLWLWQGMGDDTVNCPRVCRIGQPNAQIFHLCSNLISRIICLAYVFWHLLGNAASVPDSIKAELLQRIRSFLASTSLWTTASNGARDTIRGHRWAVYVKSHSLWSVDTQFKFFQLQHVSDLEIVVLLSYGLGGLKIHFVVLLSHPKLGR